MKLRKDQRYTIYCILLEECENPSKLPHPEELLRMCDTFANGLCWMYFIVFGSKDLYFYNKTLLPELYNKSTYFYGFGFHYDDERIEALKQCIKETENF